MTCDVFCTGKYYFMSLSTESGGLGNIESGLWTDFMKGPGFPAQSQAEQLAQK